MGRRWPAAGLGALCAAVGARDLLKQVAITQHCPILPLTSVTAAVSLLISVFSPYLLQYNPHMAARANFQKYDSDPVPVLLRTSKRLYSLGVYIPGSPVESYLVKA